MRFKVRFVGGYFHWIAVVSLACIVAGCGSKSSPFPTYMQSELLYLNDAPYSRLYVEVDTIEGVDVPDQWLNDLRTFLSVYCTKPEGIEIVRNMPIPLSEVKDLPIGAASILSLNGPDLDGDSQSAYLHVFFYDKNVGLEKAKRKSPYVWLFCPSGIFFNVGLFRNSDDKEVKQALKHELGHVLGLCKNTKHGDGVHCENQACLMSRSLVFLPEFGLLHGSGVENLLCADCRRDIGIMKSKGSDPRLSFKGPFLSRREDGYSVVSLPYCDVIIPILVESTFDWKILLSLIKDAAREELEATLKKIQKAKVRNRHVNWSVRAFWDGSKDKAFSSMTATKDMIALLRKAADDPCPHVRHYANITYKKLKREQKQ